MSYLARPRLVPLCFRSLKYAAQPLPKVNIVPGEASGEPLISVVVATFNWSQVLKLAIHSVLWQTEQNFELLIVGDACTDDSESVVKAFGDARIRWVNLPVNSGHQSAPNNAGIAMARGRYVAMLSHDDIWHPEHLRNMLSAIVSQDAGAASSLVEMIGPPGSNYRILNGIYPRGGYAGAQAIVPSGLMVRRTVTQQIGGWKDYRTIARDPILDFVRRALDAGCRFASTKELTVFKFNSALRKNSYIEKPCHEQAAYVERIESDRWFMLREALAISRVHMFRLPMHGPKFSPPPDDQALGWEVSQFRKYRGLE
jgi:glycosyltransferase involved in cell wall biosynthesis